MEGVPAGYVEALGATLGRVRAPARAQGVAGALTGDGSVFG